MNGRYWTTGPRPIVVRVIGDRVYFVPRDRVTPRERWYKLSTYVHRLGAYIGP